MASSTFVSLPKPFFAFSVKTSTLPLANHKLLGTRRGCLRVKAISTKWEPTKVVPQADRVLVRLEELAQTTSGGVLLPKAAVKFERYLTGEVVSVGSEVGQQVGPGKKVLFSDVRAYEVTHRSTRKQGEFSGVGLDKRIQAATHPQRTNPHGLMSGWTRRGTVQVARVKPFDNSSANHNFILPAKGFEVLWGTGVTVNGIGVCKNVQITLQEVSFFYSRFYCSGHRSAKVSTPHLDKACRID